MKEEDTTPSELELDGQEETDNSSTVIMMLQHFLGSLLQYPEDMGISIVDTDAVMIIELQLHPEDVASVSHENTGVFKDVQRLFTVASKEKRYSLQLVSTGFVDGTEDADADEGNAEDGDATDSTES